MKIIRLLWRLLTEPRAVYQEHVEREIAEVNRLTEEWQAKFPGKCITCSYWRYGFGHGDVKSPIPPPHECIEREA